MRLAHYILFLFGLLLTLTSTALALARHTPAESQQIAFAATDLTGVALNPSHIYRIRPDGQVLRRLTSDAAPIHTFPKWSPDGKWLVLSAITDRQHIYKMDALGRGYHQLPTSTTTDWSGVWSPDGQWIAFLGQQEDTDLYRIRPNGTDLQQLTHSPEQEGEVNWSPDGAWIAFTLLKVGGNSLWLMRPDGTNPQELNRQTSNSYALVWSADGRWLYYTVRDNNRSTLYRYEVATGQLEALYSTGRTIQEITPSPDSHWVAFMAQDLEGLVALGRLNLATRDTTPIGPLAPAFANLRYSPDSQWLLFLRSDIYEWHLYRIRPDGSHMQRLTPDGLSVSGADWQPITEVDWTATGLLMIGVGLMGLTQSSATYWSSVRMNAHI